MLFQNTNTSDKGAPLLKSNTLQTKATFCSCQAKKSANFFAQAQKKGTREKRGRGKDMVCFIEWGKGFGGRGW